MPKKALKKYRIYDRDWIVGEPERGV